eukprot:6182281-Pleurochrysis_carterae.AAC.1
MPVTCTRTYSKPSLAALGFIHCIEVNVRSRVPLNFHSCGWPISPARRSRLSASSAAAHSSLRCAVPPAPLCS